MDLNEEKLKQAVLNVLQKDEQLSDVSIAVLPISSLKAEGSKVLSFNGQVPRYPASIIKLFWAYQSLVELPESDELDLLLELMLRDSSDRAGQLVVEMLTGANPNSPNDYEEAYTRRLKLETFWKPFGFDELKATHKTFLNEYASFDDWIKTHKSPNTVTAEMVVKLWQQILTNQKEPKLPENKRQKLLQWLKRKPTNKNILIPTTDSYFENPPGSNHSEFQASLIGHNLAATEFYSKSGWRDDVICDSGIVIKEQATLAFYVYCSNKASINQLAQLRSLALFN